MSGAVWFAIGQTVAFLSVCGFAVWSARLIAEAADNSVRAAEDAAKAAQHAERIAADVREMRDALRTWIEREQGRADLPQQPPTPGGPPSPGRATTGTAGAHEVLTPQAVISRGDLADPGERPPADGSRSSRGRHAQPATSSWTAALRAAASRSSRDR